MSEWWTYRPSDFLLFSPRVYERLVESHTAAFGGWFWAAIALGLAVLALACRGRSADGRAALVIAGAALATAGWSFLWGRYASINWAAAYAAPAMVASGAAMALAGMFLRAPLRAARGPGATLALCVIAFGAAAFPLVAPLSGRPLAGAQAFAILPDPTALAALGLSALCARPLIGAALAIAPLSWTLYAAMTLFTLGAPEAWALAAGLVAFAGSVGSRIFAIGEAGRHGRA